jgi:hypothetical protein
MLRNYELDEKCTVRQVTDTAVGVFSSAALDIVLLRR